MLKLMKCMHKKSNKITNIQIQLLNIMYKEISEHNSLTQKEIFEINTFYEGRRTAITSYQGNPNIEHMTKNIEHTQGMSRQKWNVYARKILNHTFVINLIHTSYICDGFVKLESPSMIAKVIKVSMYKQQASDLMVWHSTFLRPPLRNSVWCIPPHRRPTTDDHRPIFVCWWGDSNLTLAFPHFLWIEVQVIHSWFC